jgi:hypothetical protein
MHLPSALIPFITEIPNFKLWALIFGVVIPVLAAAIAAVVTARASSKHRNLQMISEQWNVLAIVAFILGFVVTLGAVIVGPIAISQIKARGGKGWGLAVAAQWLGWMSIYSTVVTVGFFIAATAVRTS